MRISAAMTASHIAAGPPAGTRPDVQIEQIRRCRKATPSYAALGLAARATPGPSNSPVVSLDMHVSVCSDFRTATEATPWKPFSTRGAGFERQQSTLFRFADRPCGPKVFGGLALEEPPCMRAFQVVWAACSRAAGQQRTRQATSLPYQAFASSAAAGAGGATAAKPKTFAGRVLRGTCYFSLASAAGVAAWIGLSEDPRKRARIALYVPQRLFRDISAALLIVGGAANDNACMSVLWRDHVIMS